MVMNSTVFRNLRPMILLFTVGLRAGFFLPKEEHDGYLLQPFAVCDR